VGASASSNGNTEPSSHVWHPTHSADELLHFIDEHTYPERAVVRSLPAPTPVQCAAADEMMKLDDVELRDLVWHSTFVIS
jgi:hypothetical protein